ncbi:class I SAM-dependent methyltransferase [Clostridioides difficile]|nr:class I SAM-dependent methyltransferase [Clostridioides difficile]
MNNINPTLNELIEITKQQFQSNSYKNIYCTTCNQLYFNKNTYSSIKHWNEKLISLSKEERDILINFHVEEFLNCLYTVDQYLYFKNKDYITIKKIYKLLLQDIVDAKLPSEDIEYRHYSRIRNFIKKTNPSVYKINLNNNKTAQSFVCSEYTPEFQLDLLSLDIKKLKGSVLDIGCGKHGNLVNYLRLHNIQAYGIDRSTKNSKYLKSANWLEINYGQNRWNTILSNLSFSSHFLHHFLQKDGIDIVFAKVYMKILNSLKYGGEWIYAPSIPFIEDLLSTEEYQVKRTPVNHEFNKTIIKKLTPTTLLKN